MQLMGIKEYAISRNLSENLVYKLAREHKIAAGQEGRTWILDAERCDEYFLQLTTPQPRPQMCKTKGNPNFNFHEALRQARADMKKAEARACGGM